MPPPIFLTPPEEDRPVKKTRSIQDLLKSLGRAVRSKSPLSGRHNSPSRRCSSPVEANRRRGSSPAPHDVRRSSSPVDGGPHVRGVSPLRTARLLAPRGSSGASLGLPSVTATPALNLLEVPVFRGRSRSLDDGVRPATLSDCEATYRIYDQILSQGTLQIA
ncbi:hypothetical protein GE061_008161 [Apolygus lucorum]|uniref:Uncharacterized protein n=1 Tax=Apolygus lucorum TaxID=248454 RepID=A0A6A4IQ03_APOLU|nr:hypothetical protein GE061_008161 [Apolygus lucorum]